MNLYSRHETKYDLKTFSQIMFQNIEHNSDQVFLPSLRFGIYLWLEHYDLVGKRVGISCVTYHIVARILRDFGCDVFVVDLIPGSYKLYDLEQINDLDGLLLSCLYNSPSVDFLNTLNDNVHIPVLLDCAHTLMNTDIEMLSHITVLHSFGIGKEVSLGRGGVLYTNNIEFKQFARNAVSKLELEGSFEFIAKNIKTLITSYLSKGLLFNLITYPILSFLNILEIPIVDRILNEKIENYDKSVLSNIKNTKMINYKQFNPYYYLFEKSNNLYYRRHKLFIYFKKRLEELGHGDLLLDYQTTNINYLMINATGDVKRLRSYLLSCGIDTNQSGMINSDTFFRQKLGSGSRFDNSRLVEIPFNSRFSKSDIDCIVLNLCSFYRKY